MSTPYWQNGNSITVSGGAWNGLVFNRDTAQDDLSSSSPSVVFEMAGSTTQGFKITHTGWSSPPEVSVMVINVEDPGDNSGNPIRCKNLTQGTAASWYVTFYPGDTLGLYSDPNATVQIGQLTFDSASNCYFDNSPPSGGGGGDGGGSGTSQSQRKVFHNFW